MRFLHIYFLILTSFNGALALAQDRKFNLDASAGVEQGEAKNNTEKVFDGFFGGVDIGSQNIFGGSFIDGIDVLAQES